MVFPTLREKILRLTKSSMVRIYPGLVTGVPAKSRVVQIELKTLSPGGIRVCPETDAEMAFRRSSVRSRSAPPGASRAPWLNRMVEPEWPSFSSVIHHPRRRIDRENQR